VQLDWSTKTRQNKKVGPIIRTKNMRPRREKKGFKDKVGATVRSKTAGKETGNQKQICKIQNLGWTGIGFLEKIGVNLR